jgi:hypothetical protein
MKLACGSGFRNTDLAGHEYHDTAFLTSADHELRLPEIHDLSMALYLLLL